MKKLRLPPHVAWPAFILALFGAGTLGTLSMVWIARLDGGAQVVENYYQKAVSWDSTAARRAASAALGWQFALDLGEVDPATGLRAMTISLVDSTAAPVAGLAGDARLYRPQYVEAVSQAALVEAPTAGTYTFALPMNRQGLWDLEIEATRDSTIYWRRIRREIP